MAPRRSVAHLVVMFTCAALCVACGEPSSTATPAVPSPPTLAPQVAPPPAPPPPAPPPSVPPPSVLPSMPPPPVPPPPVPLSDGAAASFADALAALPSATRVSVTYGWNGLSPIAPLEHSYELARVDGALRGRTVCRSGGREQVAPEVTIPVASLAPLLERLSTVTVTSGPYSPLRWHTDDYPDHTMQLQTRSGVVTFTTRSQGEHWVPWEITASGTSGVVQSIVPAEVMRDIIALLHGIDCDAWADSLPREGARRR